MPRFKNLVVGTVIMLASPAAALGQEPERAAELLKTAYQRVYSAEGCGLELFKAGDIEIVVTHDGEAIEWEDGLLWKAGYAPVIEHERPDNVPLRPASEELLMSMLRWSMGFSPWDRRFTGAHFTLIGNEA